MAYFDSPKNRALWEKTMVGLRAERERRAATGYAPAGEERRGAAEAVNPFRKKVNLTQLEEIERQAEGVHRVRRPLRQPQAERQMGVRQEPAIRQQEAPRRSMGL